jgi:hypothetical protein
MSERPPIIVEGADIADIVSALRTTSTETPAMLVFIGEVLRVIGHPEGFARETSPVLFCNCRPHSKHGTRDDQRAAVLVRFGVAVTDSTTMGELYRLSHRVV